MLNADVYINNKLFGRFWASNRNKIVRRYSDYKNDYNNFIWI